MDLDLPLITRPSPKVEEKKVCIGITKYSSLQLKSVCHSQCVHSLLSSLPANFNL